MKLTVIAFLIFIGFGCSKETKPPIDKPVPGPVPTDTIFSARGAAEVIEFKDKLWLIGGVNQGGVKNDVWSSEDSLHWKKEL